MFKKVITIVIPIIAVIAAIFVFGLKVYEDSFDKFQYDGYVIGNIEGKENTKYYFTKDNKYKVNTTKNEVEFSNTDEQEVIVPDASFVHYADGSISTFKKAVVLNMENVKSDSLQFYNVYNGSVFTKTSNGYQIKNLDKKLEFKNFIVKISDTKYMLVGDKLTIKYGEEEKIVKNGFLEINYLDGNIIRVDNQDLTLQNISADFRIETEGIEVDLLDKKIIYEDETKVNLGEITIDSDDNIEIVPDDENTKIDEEASNKIEEFENQPVVSPGVDIGGMESGIVDTSIKKPDEVVQENAKIPDAVFTVQSLSVSANNVSAQINITDNEDTLAGTLNWKVVENATNTIMCMENGTTSSDTLNISCNKLAPGTNYSIVVRAPYTKNEVNYEKDFVQKTFVTDSTGIIIEKDYVTSNTVSFKVIVNEHSAVSKFDYVLYNENNQEVANAKGTVDVNVGERTEKIFTFDSASYDIYSNSKYSLVIRNVVSSGFNIAGYETFKIAKTLKAKPTYGSTSIQTNKLSSSFQIYLNNISDPDNGILNYRADVYDESDMTKVIARREANASSELKIEVDDTIINRRTGYVAKLYVTFYDNEKEYDLYIGQQHMKLASDVAPQVEFEVTTARQDYLKSRFVITDPKQTIKLDKPIKIILRNSSIGVEAAKTQEIAASPYDPTKFEFSVTHDNLKKLETYMYIIKATVDLNDGQGEREMEIGQFIANTPDTRPLAGSWVNDTGNHRTDAFYVTMQMLASTSDSDKEHEVKTMETLKFRLSSTEFNPTIDQCNPQNRCWTKEFVDTVPGSASSDFLAAFYDSPMIITKDFFNADRKYITYGEYKIEIIASGDYTEWKNPYKFVDGTTSITFMANPDEGSLVNEERFIDSTILNENVNQYDTYDGQMFEKTGRDSFYNEDLEDGTIVGYKVTPKIEYNMEHVEMTGYYLYDLRTENNYYELPESSIIKEPGTDTIILLFDQINNDPANTTGFKMQRGVPYGLAYTFNVNDTTVGFTSNVTDHGLSFKKFKEQPLKEIPKIEGYLSDTEQSGGNNTYFFKIFYEDPDSATINSGDGLGQTLRYTNQGSVDWNYVYCGGTNQFDCIKQDTVSLSTKTANIIVQLQYQTMAPSASAYAVSEEKGEINMLDGMTLYQPEVFPNSYIPEYEIVQGSNNITYKFKHYSANFLATYVANVRLTLVAKNKTTGAEAARTVLYKSFEENGYKDNPAVSAEINVDYSEIPVLMGDYNIETEVELLYDVNMYGFDLENDENGQAIQFNYNGNLTYENFGLENNIINVESFDYETGKLEFKTMSQLEKEALAAAYAAKNKVTAAAPEAPKSITLKKSLKGLYYTKNSKDYFVNIKKMYSQESECNNGDYTLCVFTFDSIQPTFILQESGIRAGLSLLEYTPKITIDSSVTGFVLRKYYYNTTIDPTTKEATCDPTTILETKDYTQAELEAAEYKIFDNKLAPNKTYCIRFKYYDTGKGKISVDSGKPTTATGSETEGYELRDLFYGAAYHNTNTEPQRTYFAKTTAKPKFSTISVEYETGTIKNGDPEFGEATTKEKQDKVNNRSLIVNYSVDSLENYDGFVYIIKTANTWKEINYPIESIEVDSVTDFEFKINLDRQTGYDTILPGTSYYLYAYAYRNCNYDSDPAKNEILYGDTTSDKFTCRSDGKMLLSYGTRKFSYVIMDPTITIQRIQPNSTEDRVFALKILVDDRYRAVGGYSDEASGGKPSVAKYTVSVLTDKGSKDITSFTLDRAIGIQEIQDIDACKDTTITTCTVYVKYTVEQTNTMDYKDSTIIQETKKDIAVAKDVDMGTGNVSQVTYNSITFTFTGTYNINKIKYFDYAIVPTSGSQTPMSGTNIATTWEPELDAVANKVTIKPVTIATKIDYNVTLSFKDEDEIIVVTEKFTGVSR